MLLACFGASVVCMMFICGYLLCLLIVIGYCVSFDYCFIFDWLGLMSFGCLFLFLLVIVVLIVGVYGLFGVCLLGDLICG